MSDEWDARAQDVREQIVHACRHLTAVGLSPGSSGNISVRIDDRLLVTPTGSSLSRVTADELAVVTLDGEVVGEPRPSKEVPLHRAVYTQRADAVAVVHLHSPYAVAASCLEVPDGEPTIPPLTPYGVMRVHDLPVAAYARPGSAARAEGVAALAGDHAVLLLANHGSVVAGTSLWGAVDLAEEVEAAARVALLLRGLPARHLTPDQVAELRG